MGILLSLIVIIGSCVFGLISALVLITWMRSHRLRIRDPMNKGRYIEDYWIIEKKDKHSGVLEWKSVFWQRPLSTPRPPDAAIEVGKKGRKFAEAYKLSEDQYCWITDKGITIKEIKNEKTKKTEKVIMDVLDNGDYQYIDTFKPFSATQRDAIVSQFKKAQEISQNRWTPDKLIMAGSLGMLFVLIMLVVIFWGDLAAPLVDMQGATAGMMQQAETITKNQAIIMQNLGMKVDDLDLTVTQKPKPTTNIVATDPLVDPLELFRRK